MTTTPSGSKSTPEQSERHFSVHFSKSDSADRQEVEEFITATMNQTYGVTVGHFKPYLMSLRGDNGRLMAVCGLHSAMVGKLSLERFLDKPIEEILSGHTGSPVKRADIVEIDNFSVADLAMSRHLVTAINDQLYFTAKQWAVLTAAPALLDIFTDLGLSPEVLAEADVCLLPEEDRLAWGNYFEQKPQILGLRRMERRAMPRPRHDVRTST